MSMARYAIYFAPDPDEQLARFGAGVLGYDAFSGKDLPQLTPPGLSDGHWRYLTAEPRRYGFHATLKAPFRLAEGQTEQQLLDALAKFAPGYEAFCFDLQLAEIGGFIALTPVSTPGALVSLERDIVVAFDIFRAPLTGAEIVRRLDTRLTVRQRASLDLYGYPYVHDDFRFHMTLTGRLFEEERADTLGGLGVMLEQHSPKPRALVRSLSVFRQDEPESRFKVIARAALQLAVATS
jgi:hypothetical protein